MRTLIVVPTHNEEDNIDTALGRIAEAAPDVDVLVIDDASTDATRSIVEQHHAARPHVRLLCRPDKRGLGDAYLHAFELALREGYDAVVEMDADLSHDATALPTMLAVAACDIDVVIGSRYVPGGTVIGWPRRRTWLSRWGNRYAAIVLGLAVNDATSGYRLYRSDALRRLDLGAVRADGYAFQIEMTYRAVEAGMSVVEVPIVFRDRVAGTSKMSRRIITEAFTLVTVWGLTDLLTLRRRRRAYHRH